MQVELSPSPEPSHAGLHDAAAVEISVVLPCLNEADTLARCIAKAQQAFAEHGLQGEIIVADNGSSDASAAIAEEKGARLIRVPTRGYGAALMGGIAVAQGKYILMGDADDSYDFREIPRFVAELRKGNDLVQGCRLPSGGGKVMPGAMPLLHRWLGNPFFSFLARRFFRSPVHDVYCGMRAFTRAAYQRLDLRCTGMEFATEMIIKSSLYGMKISEVPITLHPDGRTTHPPHLKTFRDGWRTLRFLLLCSPGWVFLAPGMFLILLGGLGYALAMPHFTIGGVGLDAHTLLCASLAILLGYQSILFFAFAKTFAVGEGILPEDRRLSRILGFFKMEVGLLLGTLAFAVGVVLLLLAVNLWRLHDFGALDYGTTMRLVIPGVTAAMWGFQTVLASFFLGILRLRRRESPATHSED